MRLTRVARLTFAALAGIGLLGAAVSQKPAAETHLAAPSTAPRAGGPDVAMPANGAGNAPARSASDRPLSPERQIASALEAIGNQQVNKALEIAEQLVQQYPNYRLAHLVHGDLLLARAQPLAAFGGQPAAASEQVQDLKAEAVARLNAQRNKPPEGRLPKYLLQLRPDQRHAVVVDTGRSRLYVYENEAGALPRLVGDYYISQGKLGDGKRREGDLKTPIGVYQVQADLSKQKLPDLYGSGAFPIDYPNEWDKRVGRGGSGIWLHGTPSDTYARPPLASEGCVVLTNEDLMAVSKFLQVNVTPVIIAPSVEWAAASEMADELSEFKRQMEAWRADWESRDVERYLAHYSPKFKTDSMNLQRFAAQKRQVNANKQWIQLGIENLSVFRSPQDDVMVVTFDQNYRSNDLTNKGRKRQYWAREGNVWKIVYEGLV